MNRLKFTKFALLALCIFIIFIVVINTVQKGENKLQKNEVYRTDKEPIAKRFPKLGSFEKCLWEAKIIGNDSLLSSPGPTSYSIRGFVFLDKKTFEGLKGQYKWEYMNKSWTPSMDMESIQKGSLKWAYSEEFNSNVKPMSYIGKFYLDLNNGLVYFEVEK